jgi:hypothetical protein
MEEAQTLLARAFEDDELIPAELIARVIVDLNRIANALERGNPGLN